MYIGPGSTTLHDCLCHCSDLTDVQRCSALRVLVGNALSGYVQSSLQSHSAEYHHLDRAYSTSQHLVDDLQQRLSSCKDDLRHHEHLSQEATREMTTAAPCLPTCSNDVQHTCRNKFTSISSLGGQERQATKWSA
jgi:chromosome condensin MukBEF ATPase and DNA-binding subunit MukB